MEGSGNVYLVAFICFVLGANTLSCIDWWLHRLKAQGYVISQQEHEDDDEEEEFKPGRLIGFEREKSKKGKDNDDD